MASANTLESVFNVVMPDAESGQKFDGKKIRRARPMGKNSENIHKINFKSIAKLGLSIRTVRMANEVVGSYTGDRLTQRGITTGMTFLQYGVGITQFGLFGVAYAAGDLAYRSLNYEVKRSRENRIANYIKDLSGNNARNQSRSPGVKI
jgi:hypothetical protein